jgi:L-alanine-DL-glutamate epimerase-like enolase superfamily enzyme
VTDALGHVAGGFRTLKIKVGAGGDDGAAVRAVRQAVGPDVRLRVDANQGWTAEKAITIVRGWEDAGTGIEFVEQPVAARRLDDLALVTSSVDTPILADEAVWDTADLREIIRRRAADAVNLKLAKIGGLTEARAMAALAAGSSMRVIVGCMMESTVGIGAAASLVSSLGPQLTGEPQDIDAGLWLSASAIDGGVVYSGDRITLPAAPGAGIEGLHARTRSAAPDLSGARLEAAAQSATEER